MVPSISDMYDNERFVSARKLLIIISILFLTINVSGAKLIEANTFIFKISFENSLGFNVILFVGVLILTIRYYSVANMYHAAIFQLWSKNMLSDSKMLQVHRSGNSVFEEHDKDDISVSGFLARHPRIQEIAVESLIASPRNIEFEYLSRGLFERNLRCYHPVNANVPTIIRLGLTDGDWNSKDFFLLLIFESKYQIVSLFKRHEFLEVTLPYLFSLISILYYFSTKQVSFFVSSKIESAFEFINALHIYQMLDIFN